MTLRPIVTVLATGLLLCDPGIIPAHATQGLPPAKLSGTLVDPLGKPAENTLLTLIGRESDVSINVRTDADGHFLFADIAPGRYLLRTPATDLMTPSMLDLASGENRVDARLEVDDTAVVIRVCRECKPADYRLPDAITREFTNQRDEPSAAIIMRAEPEEGWDAFNQRPFPYPTAMKNSKLEGVVEIEGTIAVDGTSADVKVVSSTETRLNEVAVPLVQQQRWHPARIRSTPVAVPLRVTVEFSIYGD